jgi:hypothetical protein
MSWPLDVRRTTGLKTRRPRPLLRRQKPEGGRQEEALTVGGDVIEQSEAEQLGAVLVRLEGREQCGEHIRHARSKHRHSGKCRRGVDSSIVHESEQPLATGEGSQVMVAGQPLGGSSLRDRFDVVSARVETWGVLVIAVPHGLAITPALAKLRIDRELKLAWHSHGIRSCSGQRVALNCNAWELPHTGL